MSRNCDGSMILCSFQLPLTGRGCLWTTVPQDQELPKVYDLQRPMWDRPFRLIIFSGAFFFFFFLPPSRWHCIFRFCSLRFNNNRRLLFVVFLVAEKAYCVVIALCSIHVPMLSFDCSILLFHSKNNDMIFFLIGSCPEYAFEAGGKAGKILTSHPHLTDD